MAPFDPAAEAVCGVAATLALVFGSLAVARRFILLHDAMATRGEVHMRKSGFIRLWIVFAIVLWAIGFWQVARGGAPSLAPPILTADCGGDFLCRIWTGAEAVDWRDQWGQWFSVKSAELWAVALRPIWITLALAFAGWALIWVLRGFEPKRSQNEPQ